MGSNQEFFTIQSWMADWCKTSVEDCKFSREDIRDICRGPMREVLLDFLLPRFRTDEQIKVIRSNLYLSDVIQNPSSTESGSGGQEATHQDQQIKELKRKVEESEREKVEIVSRISKTVGRISDSKMNLQDSVVKQLKYFETSELREQFIKERVASTNALLQDLNQFKPGLADRAVSVTNQDADADESASSQLTQLTSLYNNASTLFNLYFLQNADSSANQSAEIQALISSQTSELIQTGLSPNLIEKWATMEHDKSAVQINKASLKFSDVMNPLEELSSEAEALHIKLMKMHVDLHFKNKQLLEKLSERKDQNTKRLQNAVLNGPGVVPADLLCLIKKEEQHYKLIKCRDLMKNQRRLDYSTGADLGQDLLKLLCGDSFNSEEDPVVSFTKNQINDNGNSSRSSFRMSVSSVDGNSSFTKQETLEELTCSLLKSYPQSCNQMESTIKQCKKVVLEKFPKLFQNETGNSGIYSHASIESACRPEMLRPSDLPIEIPHELLQNYDLVTTVPEKVSPPDPSDLLSEVFRLKTEIEQKRMQCAILCSERASEN